MKNLTTNLKKSESPMTTHLFVFILVVSVILVIKLLIDNHKLKRQNNHLQKVNSGIIADKIIATDFNDYTKLSGSPIHLLCEGIFNQIDAVGAKNFYEMRMRNAKTGDEYTVLFQKVGGETPVDQLFAAKNEIKMLKERLDEIKD